MIAGIVVRGGLVLSIYLPYNLNVVYTYLGEPSTEIVNDFLCQKALQIGVQPVGIRCNFALKS